jgi:tetratricopeptide (TPR) repeat protein
MNKIMIPVLSVVVLTGCLATTGPTTSVTAVMPAASGEAARLRKIAVLPFNGPSGHEFALEVEAMLASITVDDQPYFTVVERQKFKELNLEIERSQSPAFSSQEALRFGKRLGVNALYTGVLSKPVTNVNRSQESRTVCAEDDRKKKGFLGMPKCKRWAETKVSCSRTEAIYAFTPKLIEVQTGQIVFSNSIQGIAVASSCADHSEPTPSSAQLLEAAKTSALANFRKQIAPSLANVSIQLMDSAQGINDENAKRKLGQGIEFAKAGRLDRACELWQDADKLASDSVSITYNLGVCAEAEGKYPLAKKK